MLSATPFLLALVGGLGLFLKFMAFLRKPELATKANHWDLRCFFKTRIRGFPVHVHLSFFHNGDFSLEGMP